METSTTSRVHTFFIKKFFFFWFLFYDKINIKFCKDGFSRPIESLETSDGPYPNTLKFTMYLLTLFFHLYQ